MIAFFPKKILKQNKIKNTKTSSDKYLKFQIYYKLGPGQNIVFSMSFFANYSNKVKRKLDFVQLRNEFHELLIVSLIILDPNNHLPFHFDN